MKVIMAQDSRELPQKVLWDQQDGLRLLGFSTAVSLLVFGLMATILP